MKPLWLPNDICRCHDSQCSLHTHCLRWLLRANCGMRTPHADTLHDGEAVCGSFIDEGDSK